MGSTQSSVQHPHSANERRKLLSKIEIPLEPGVRCVSEYVECPRGNLIYSKCFIPDKSIIAKPKGLICQCIGYTSYVDYELTVIGQDWCKKGYIFFAWDHHGHGRSDGLWVHIERFELLVDDTVFMCNYARKKYPMRNNYLFGTSMGGNVVCRVLLTMHTEFVSKRHWNGVVLFSPMISVDDKHLYHPLIMYIAENFFAHYFPTVILLPKTVGKDRNNYSRDPKMAEFLSENPMLFPFGPRPRTGIELLKTSKFVQDSFSKLAQIDIPLLVLHGDADDTTKSSMSLKMVDEIAACDANKDVAFRGFQGAYHGLMTDACKDSVLQVACDWMDQRNHETKHEK